VYEELKQTHVFCNPTISVAQGAALHPWSAFTASIFVYVRDSQPGIAIGKGGLTSLVPMPRRLGLPGFFRSPEDLNMFLMCSCILLGRARSFVLHVR